MSELSTVQIPIQLVTWPGQERTIFDQAELLEMAETVKTHGVVQPIIVFRDGEEYIGWCGERRWRAAQLAGLKTIPAIIREKPVGELEAKEVRLIENSARQNLRPVEQAIAFHQLMKLGGYGISEVAKRIGIKPPMVSKSLSLLNLSEATRRQIDSGAISAGAGYELSKVADPQLQSELAAKVASGELSRDALAGEIRSRRKAGTQANSQTQSRLTARLSHKRSVTVCGTELTLESVIKTLEELLGRLRSARTKGLSLATILRMLSDESRRPD